MAQRVLNLVVGCGGPTSSGKTTLVKHLATILRGGDGEHAPLIVHQDDFAPPSERIPWNEEHGMQDWDTPNGSIDYDAFLIALQHVRSTGSMPAGFSSHDASNVQIPVAVPSSLVASWQTRLAPLLTLPARGTAPPTHIRLVLADGFLLYYSARVRAHLDVRLFLRIRKKLLKERREVRGGYNTAEGQLWTDPPGYFEKLLWPAYEEAHKNTFVDGDVEAGALVPAALEPTRPPISTSVASLDHTERDAEGEDGGPISGLVLLEAQQLDGAPTPMADLLQRACEEIERALLALRSDVES